MTRLSLNRNKLKVIAIIAMTLDHLAWSIAPGYCTVWWIVLLHIIGRLTAPIMWFFIAEGYHYTRSKTRYALRLFLLAVIGHFAYNFCFDIPFLPLKTGIFNQTSVGWALLGGMLALWLLDTPKIAQPIQIVGLILLCLVTFPADWSTVAVMAIVSLGQNRGSFKRQMLWMSFWIAVYAAVYFVFIDHLYGLLQLFALLTIPLLACYNGQKGNGRWIGKLFYIYYPLHLVICGLIRIFLYG